MQETIELARNVDTVIVVGGHESGNTRRLAEAVKAEGKKVLHIETPEQLDPKFLSQSKRIGLTAGASTPKFLIDATQEALHSL